MPVAHDKTEKQNDFIAFMLNRFKGC
ncbi:uncharacterized protein METZ01_LOCUS126291 [marine metagenome]|uniref:Uncharacterized protein n=1 Tax=marine metagenome TaxID=408172 RepID=A0A381YAJ1_9ZZZZ